MPMFNAAKLPYVWTNQDTGNAIIASAIPVGIGASIVFSSQEQGSLTKYFKKSTHPTWFSSCPCVHAGCAFWSMTPLGYASYRVFKNTAGMMTDKSKVALALYGSCMAVSVLSGYFTQQHNYLLDAVTKAGIAGTAIAFSLAFREIDSTAFLCSIPFTAWSIIAAAYHFTSTN